MITELQEKERRALFARFAKIAYSGPKLGKEQGKKLGFNYYVRFSHNKRGSFRKGNRPYFGHT